MRLDGWTRCPYAVPTPSARHGVLKLLDLCRHSIDVRFGTSASHTRILSGSGEGNDLIKADTAVLLE